MHMSPQAVILVFDGMNSLGDTGNGHYGNCNKRQCDRCGDIAEFITIKGYGTFSKQQLLFY